MRVGAGDVDDGATRRHAVAELARQNKSSRQVDFERAIPAFEAELVKRLELDDSGMVDQAGEWELVPDLARGVDAATSVTQVDLADLHAMRARELCGLVCPRVVGPENASKRCARPGPTRPGPDDPPLGTRRDDMEEQEHVVPGQRQQPTIVHVLSPSTWRPACRLCDTPDHLQPLVACDRFTVGMAHPAWKALASPCN